MTATIYVPGTEERDLKKVILSLQQIAAYLTRGQLAFPAVQQPSTDANTLDDYEEGTWTPSLSFVTPGDLAVTYSVRVGLYTKIGRLVFANVDITTSAFTHTTASGTILINGLPFTSANSAQIARAACLWQGITKAGYTDAVLSVPSNSAFMIVSSSGSAQTAVGITAADMPSGGAVRFSGCVTYFT